MMKNKGISWLIYCIMAVLCAFSLGWVLGSGGTHETVTVQVNADVSYPVTIRAIRPGSDDDSLPISQY